MTRTAASGPETIVSQWATPAVGVLLAAEVAAVAVLTRLNFPHRTLWLEALTLPLYLGAVGLLARSRLPAAAASLLVITVGAVLQLCAITGKPISSDDDFRYLWDAKVQLAGTDPYRFPPAAPQLAHLRDAYLFPNLVPCRFNPLPDGGCTVINRPEGRTIYPPVAQLAFAGLRLLSFGGHGQHMPLELGAAAGAVAVAVLLARRGAPPWQVAVWAWCPVTVVELGNNAHIDWLATLLAVLALHASADRHEARAGVLLGAAVAVKLYPALLAMAMLRRRPVLLLSCAAGIIALAYLPHVLAVGTGVLGYLPSYLRDEQYLNGARFLLFYGLWTPGLSQVVVVAVLALTALYVLRRSDPDHPAHGGLIMVGAAIALATPGQGWYAVLLVALIAMTGRLAMLPLALVPTLVYLSDGDFGVHLGRDALYYRVAAALTVAALLAHWVARRSRTTRSA